MAERKASGAIRGAAQGGVAGLVGIAVNNEILRLGTMDPTTAIAIGAIATATWELVRKIVMSYAASRGWVS